MTSQAKYNTTENESQQSPLDLVLSRLPGYKAVSSGYSACCPAHNDKNPSLSIWEDKEGHCGLFCRAGCQHDAICASLGIEKSDLYRKGQNHKSRPPRIGITVFDLAMHKYIHPLFLINEIELTETNKGIRIPYPNPDKSQYKYARFRKTLETRPEWEFGAKSIPYGLDRLAEATDDYLTIVEGESDCWTLWTHGLPALGIPGAKMANASLQSEHINLLPSTLYIVQETDNAGANFPFNVARRLAELGYQGKVFKIRLGVKDPNDLHKKLHAEGRLSEFKDEWQKVLDQSTPIDIHNLPTMSSDPIDALIEEIQGIQPNPLEAKQKFTPNEVSLSKIRKYYDMQEYGDGLLFAEVFKGLVCYDHTEKKWYVWQGHWWKRDNTGLAKRLVSGYLGSVYLKAVAELNIKRAEVAEEIVRYETLAKQKEEEGDSEAKGKIKLQIADLESELSQIKVEMKCLTGRADELRKASRNKNVLSFAMSERNIAITSDKWDRDPWLLGVANGVLDLRTGERRDGKPEDYIKSVSPTEWQGLAAACPRFERFLEEIFETTPQKEELISFLQRLFGYSITGLSTEAIFPILWGLEGRNGKDTLFKRFKRVLGPSIADAISNDVLLNNSDKWKTSGSATPHLVDLQGKRVVWGSETKQGDIFNIAQVKHLTGGGSISARHLYGEQYSFDPSHTLFLMTNNRPHADAKDKAFWTRACLIEFHMRFVENPIEENERLIDYSLDGDLDREASGILAWLVRGCLEWQKKGMKRPEIVNMATEEYRKSEDLIQLFLSECCIQKEKAIVRGKQIYDAYTEWCKENYIKPMNGNLFGKEMESRFEKKRDKKSAFYQGVGLLTDDDDPFPGVGTSSSGVGTSSSGVGTQNSPNTASQASLTLSEEGVGVGSVVESEEGAHSSKNQFPIGGSPEVPTLPTPFSSDNHVKQPLEQSEGISQNVKVPTPDSKVPTPLSQDVLELYTQYMQHLRDNHRKDAKASLLWRAPDSGCSNVMLALKEHHMKTKEMIESGDMQKMKAALEAMKRTLGIWED